MEENIKAKQSPYSPIIIPLPLHKELQNITDAQSQLTLQRVPIIKSSFLLLVTANNSAGYGSKPPSSWNENVNVSPVLFLTV